MDLGDWYTGTLTCTISRYYSGWYWYFDIYLYFDSQVLLCCSSIDLYINGYYHEICSSVFQFTTQRCRPHISAVYRIKDNLPMWVL